MTRWLVSAPCEYEPWPVEYVVDDEDQVSSYMKPVAAHAQHHGQDPAMGSSDSATAKDSASPSQC